MEVLTGREAIDRRQFIAIGATFCPVGMVVVGQLYVAIPLIPRISAAWHVTPGTAAWLG